MGMLSNDNDVDKFMDSRIIDFLIGYRSFVRKVTIGRRLRP